MKRALVCAACVVCVASAACGDPGAPRDATPERVVGVADCDHPPAAPDLADVTETEGDYDAELAALDLASLPAQIDASQLSAFTRDLVAYLLEVAPLELGVIDRDAILAHLDDRSRSLERVALAGFAYASAHGTDGADISFLRRGLFRFYACARGQRTLLDDVVRDLDLDDGEVIESVPKRGPRRVRQAQVPDRDRGTIRVYVAETLVNDEVRETEVITHGARADGALDFAAYDAHGELVRSSTFAAGEDGTVVSSSPYTCMTCHRDRDADTGFSVVVPLLP